MIYRFDLLKEFGESQNVKEEVTINFVDNQLQDTCGFFSQLYFYENLFQPLSNNKMIKEKYINKETIATLLNEIFVLDKKENEPRLEKYNSEPISANILTEKRYFNKDPFYFRNFLRAPILKNICVLPFLK